MCLIHLSRIIIYITNIDIIFVHTYLKFLRIFILILLLDNLHFYLVAMLKFYLK